MLGESLGLVEREEGFVQLRDAVSTSGSGAANKNEIDSSLVSAVGGGDDSNNEFLFSFLQQPTTTTLSTPPPTSSSSSASSRFFQTPLNIPSSTSTHQPHPFFLIHSPPNKNNNGNKRTIHQSLFPIMESPKSSAENNDSTLNAPAVVDNNNSTNTGPATGLDEMNKNMGEDVMMEDTGVENTSMSVSSVVVAPLASAVPKTTILGSFRDRGEAFLERLKSIGGGGMGLPSSEEFSQFERMYYSQLEEVRMLKEKFSSARLAVLQLEEEKRSLEMKLVGERAERESERRNAQAELERSQMMAENAAYGIKSEVDSWKRKTEAAQQELKWLKEQLRTLEMEKIDALRRLGEVKEKSESAFHYGAAIEAYAARQKEVMAENRKALMELEQARDMLAKIVEGNGMRMKALAAHLRLENKARQAAEAKRDVLEAELVTTRANLVQERGELHRSQTAESRKTELLKKVMNENSALHNGIEMLLHSFEGKLDIDSKEFIQNVQQLHKEIQSTLGRMKLDMA